MAKDTKEAKIKSLMDSAERLLRPVLPLPIPMEDGRFEIVEIPRMTENEFAFFKAQLEMYKSVIVEGKIPTGEWQAS